MVMSRYARLHPCGLAPLSWNASRSENRVGELLLMSAVLQALIEWLKRPDKHADLTNHGFWNPSCLGPWNLK